MSRAEATKIVIKYSTKLREANYPFTAIYLFGFTDVVKHATENAEAGSSLFFISILAIFINSLQIISRN